MVASLILSLLILRPAVAMQASVDPAKQLEDRYKGMFVRVRDLVSDSKIRYDAAGNLAGKWHAGRWTWHSNVEVTAVTMKDRVLKIKANRLLLNYNRGTHKFTPFRSGPVEFEIATAADADGKIDVEKEWNKAFLKPAEDYPLDMQPYWKPFYLMRNPSKHRGLRVLRKEIVGTRRSKRHRQFYAEARLSGGLHGW